MRLIKSVIIVFLLSAILIQSGTASAASVTANQNMANQVSTEVNQYLKKIGGTVTYQYQDLVTGESFQRNGKTAGRAASTIKLPLAIYVMELASKGTLDLNQKLVYQKSDYYGGSGVIQKAKFGTTYTIRDLVSKAMIHSDNIAFIMLKKRVGQSNFIAYMKSLGAKNTYPNGQNLTSASDLILYAKKLYQFSQTSPLGKELAGYLKKTDYNTTIPKGIPSVPVAHKVGMIPESEIYNDVGIVYDKNPFAFAIMTQNISYEKSQKVIADIAAIVYKYHKAKEAASYFSTNTTVPVYQDSKKKTIIGYLKQSQIFKVQSLQGAMYAIRFGKTSGYIERRLVTALISTTSTGFSKDEKNAGTIKSSINVNVLSKPGSGIVIGILNKNLETYYSAKVNNYFAIDIGGKIGYVSQNDVSVIGLNAQ